MSKSKLLPCPFCGGEPSSIILGMSICDGHQIVCENECHAGPFVDGKDEDEAIKFWNWRRPVSRPLGSDK